MKKFVFTLHALLHVKELLEKQERNTMLLLTRKLNQLTDEREELQRRRAEAAEGCSAKMREGIHANEAVQYADYLRLMTDLLKEQDTKIASVLAELDSCRTRLVELLKEINMLQKVKEKQYQQYLVDAQTEDEKMIGDFVSYQTTQKPTG